jgi:hypothetical protein
MTSIKKPFIAIAAAVALAATTFVAPASAATTALTVNAVAVATAPTTAANAVALPVPADNTVDATDALKIALTGVTAGTTVTATATDALLLTSLTGATAASGSATASVATGTGTTADIFVFTKTTKTGTVLVTADGVTTTYYVKGTAGALNTIKVDAPSAGLGTTAKVTVTGTDVFGNAVSGSAVALQVVSTTATATHTITTTADGTAVKELTGLAVGSYDLIATATVATAVTGLTAPTGFVRGTLKVVDLAALVAEKDAELTIAKGKVTDLEAQVAELTAKLALAHAAALGNKKKYNALAIKWNKKFPKAKVALLK